VAVISSSWAAASDFLDEFIPGLIKTDATPSPSRAASSTRRAWTCPVNRCARFS
jgi:hypothetical protein